MRVGSHGYRVWHSYSRPGPYGGQMSIPMTRRRSRQVLRRILGCALVAVLLAGASATGAVIEDCILGPGIAVDSDRSRMVLAAEGELRF